MFLPVFFIIVIALAASCAVIFNQLVKYRNLVQEAWGGIDAQLKRRYDLIPNIIEVVKGYMQYERNLFEEITELRTKVIKSQSVMEKEAAENDLSDIIKDICVVVENYPDLKADRSFLEFQKNLIEIEDQIQMARRYYNGTVRNYNTAVESFPGNIVAGLLNFTKAEFFEIEYATERQVPDVNLGGK